MESKMGKQAVLARYLPTMFFLILLVLLYLVVKPFLFTLIFAVILAYILTPVHNAVKKIFKNENVSALILIILLAAVLSIGGYYFVKTVVSEAADVVLSVKNAEIGSTQINELLASPYIAPVFEKAALIVVAKGTEILVSLPLFFLNIIILLFVLFFAFKEKDIGKKIVNILPLRSSYKQGMYDEIKKVSNLVIYGFIVVGVIQGLIGGLSFFIFGVPNPFFWTIVMIVVSILPIGPWLVWLPAAIVMFLTGNLFAAIGLAAYGFIITNNIDMFIRPMLVSRKANIHPLIVLVGGLGGILAFGVIGLIIGPLIIAFMISFLKVYKEETQKDYRYTKDHNHKKDSKYAKRR